MSATSDKKKAAAAAEAAETATSEGKPYSDDPTLRAGQIAHEQSFTETTETEQFHSDLTGSSEDAKAAAAKAAKSGEAPAKQPLTFSDVPVAPPAPKTVPSSGAGSAAAPV